MYEQETPLSSVDKALKASVMTDINQVCDFCEKHRDTPGSSTQVWIDFLAELFSISFVLDEDFTHEGVLRNSVSTLQDVLAGFRALHQNNELQRHVAIVTKLIQTLQTLLERHHGRAVKPVAGGGGRGRGRGMTNDTRGDGGGARGGRGGGGRGRGRGMTNDSHAGLTALLGRLRGDEVVRI
jgi:hypothetical protein